MSDSDPFEQWIETQRNRKAPAGFADRVAAAHAAATPASPYARLWTSRPLLVAAWLAACLVLAVRIGITVAVFVTR